MDELPNMTWNSTDEIYNNPSSVYEILFLELFTIVALVSIVANFLIIFVILKYKKLRQEVTNMIIAHVNILQAVYLMATPLTLRVSMALEIITSVHVTTFCILNEIESTVMLATSMFLLLLISDWFLKLYYEVTYIKFCRVYKFFVVCIYIFVIFFSSLTLQYCLKDNLLVPTLVSIFFGNICIMIFLVVMNIIHKIKKRKLSNAKRNNVGLVITNIYYLLWCPALILALSAMAGFHAPTVLVVFASMGFSSPIFNFFYLFYYDDNFNVFFRKVFRCQCNNYENETLEDQPVIYSDVNSVQYTENY